MSKKVERWTLAIVVALYLGLGVAYSVVNPILESPDEILNYQNIRFLAEERRLPILRAGELSKAHHPPLYYTLGALLVGWVPDQNLDLLSAQTNPFWAYRLGEPGTDNKSQYLHDPAYEGWPYRDVALGIHLMRWVSLLMGAGVVLLVYQTARQLFAGEPWLAVGAATVLAFNPMFLYIQSSVHNDALTNLWAALTLWGIVHYWLKGPSTRRAAFLGLTCGLGALTKITFLFLLPAVALTILWRGWLERRTRPDWRPALVQHALICAGSVVLVAGWWFVRNQLLYGEPTSMGQQAETWGIREDAPAWGAALRELGFLHDSFWGVFGYGQIPMPRWIYALIRALMWVATGGLALWAFRSWRRGWSYRAPAALMAVLLLAPLAAFAVTFARMSISATANFGRYLFTGYGALAPAIVLGVTEWVPTRARRGLVYALSILSLLLAVGALLFVLAVAYQPAPRLSASQAQQEIEHRLDWQLGDVVSLLGYRLSPPAVRPGEDVTVTLFWQPLKAMERNYAVFVHLLGQDGKRVGARDTYPGLGNDPTTLWKPGEIIADAIPVRVRRRAQGPILLEIEAGLYDLERGDRLPITDADGNSVGYPVIGTLKLVGTPQAQATPTYADGSVFSGGLVLTGYDLPDTTPSPGSPLRLVLYWSPDGPLPADYTVFVHLVDQAGQIVAQGDGPPRSGRYPSTVWAAGENFDDAHMLVIPSDLSPGEYRLLVGLYRPDNGSRLPLDIGSDSVLLDRTVTIRDATAP